MLHINHSQRRIATGKDICCVVDVYIFNLDFKTSHFLNTDFGFSLLVPQRHNMYLLPSLGVFHKSSEMGMRFCQKLLMPQPQHKNLWHSIFQGLPLLFLVATRNLISKPLMPCGNCATQTVMKLELVLLARGCDSVVEHIICMQKVPVSIPTPPFQGSLSVPCTLESQCCSELGHWSDSL